MLKTVTPTTRAPHAEWRSRGGRQGNLGTHALGVVILPELRHREFEATRRRAEQLGFDHAWIYDHLA